MVYEYVNNGNLEQWVHAPTWISYLVGSHESYSSYRKVPEHVNSGLLNRKKDVYRFGVLLSKAITGKHPVNLVDCLIMMMGNRRSNEMWFDHMMEDALGVKLMLPNPSLRTRTLMQKMAANKVK
ncbi:hypothetical protein M8C21_031366 [Ambrosia artemisiifolia]|uniref:non-specific serine/threonine protein kinase n=1 Tax=Ambrosia artemisiifolia TaxID=4212 RepID=A0AAD5G879_AMBAR|nr:hypothetical protein M8C21_031366 [Ambrosia artemisiifolia]